MEKINVSDPLFTASIYSDEQMVSNLKKYPVVQQLVHKYHLSDQDLLDNYSLLSDYAKNVSKCEGCLGLSFCRQDFTGKVMQVFQDPTGRLLDRFGDCRFTIEKNEKMGHKNYFRISDMSEQDYLINFKEIDIQNESSEYLKVYIALGHSIDGDKGAYIYGQTGVGKSYLLKAICNEYAKMHKRVCFCKVPLLMQNFYAAMNNQEELNDLLRTLYRADVLVLDDIGSEKMTKFIRDSLLFPVLDERLTHNRKTYFTSNYSLSDLQKRYSNIDNTDDTIAADRLIDRIRPMTEQILLKGKTRR